MRRHVEWANFVRFLLAAVLIGAVALGGAGFFCGTDVFRGAAAIRGAHAEDDADVYLFRDGTPEAAVAVFIAAGSAGYAREAGTGGGEAASGAGDSDSGDSTDSGGSASGASASDSGASDSGASDGDASASGAVASAEPTARDQLIDQMLAWIWKDNGTKRESTGSESPGQCRRYLINVFRRFADGYRIAAYPKVKLWIPLKYKRVPDPPRLPGTQWLMHTAAEGNPFEEVAGFYYDTALSATANKLACEEFLTNIRRGDILQMNGTWGPKASNSGNHTLIFREDYAADSDVLRWSDSNMKNTRSGGKRYGFVIADEERTKEEFMSWMLHKNNGATLYRLREDLIPAPAK